MFLFFNLLDNQQHDLANRTFSSSSAEGGHYFTHSSNDSTRPLLEPTLQQQQQQIDGQFQHPAPSSTGSSSHSSSGISSSIESPYNHWKYLTPLSIKTSKENKQVSSSITEPIPLSSS